MFFKNKQKEKELIDRELIDRELAIYKKEKLAEITLDIAEAQERGALQEREYECEWHGKKEKLETELAVLEEGKKNYISNLEERNKNYVEQYQAVVKAKDKTIEILESTLSSLIKNLPKEISQTINNK